MLPTKKSLARSIALFGGAQAATVLAALVRTKVAALTIGPAGVGLNALYVTISNLVAQLMGCGLSNSSIPALSQQQGEARLQHVAILRTLGLLLALASLPVVGLAACLYGAEVLLLAPGVALLVLAGIETAVLKSLGATRQLAGSIVLTALLSVVCTVPLFWWLGRAGVIWAVSLTTLGSSLVTCMLGLSACPVAPRLAHLGAAFWRQVRPMLVLGVAFLVSGVMAQGVDLLVQTFITHHASLSEVGLYKAGYQMAITYTGMIFAAVSNDYYPRLAAVSAQVDERNALVRRQMQVLLLIVTPLILLFVLLVPIIIPLLLSSEFLPIVPMVRIASLSVILKALYLPMAYLPVAQGRSWHFLLLESLSWAFTAAGILLGFTLHGLSGIGWGILLSNLLDLLITWLFCRRWYGFR